MTVIRGLSLQEIRFRDLFRVLGKEFVVSILCGFTLAVCNLVKLLLLDRVGFPVAAVVCLTLLITVIVSKLVGTLLPMAAKRVGFDPAVMASPLITTVVDVLALLIYFEAAALILRLG